MKVKLIEFASCFSVEIKAETKDEVVKLARFGINKTKEIRHMSAQFNEDGTAGASIVIGKRKDSNSYL